MAAEAVADDAYRNAERQITARMTMIKRYQYLETKCCSKVMDRSTLEEGH